MRQEFSKRTRLEAWQRCKGHCEGCTAKLHVGKFEYDHDKPAEFGGTATLDNCRVLCTSCHGEKTGKRDVPAIAKSNRIRNRHAGIKRPRTIRAWRRFDGSIVRAD